MHFFDGGKAIYLNAGGGGSSFEANDNCVADALNSDKINLSLFLCGSRYRQLV